MGRKGKLSEKQRIKAVEEYMKGEGSCLKYIEKVWDTSGNVAALCETGTGKRHRLLLVIPKNYFMLST